MSVFEKLLPLNLYHSYIVEGEPNTTAKELLNFLEVRGDIEKNNADILFQVYESFTINDSREIKDWHSKLGITNGKRICVIVTKFINREAEQTLLKIIEEPAFNTHFFIIIPDSSVLLPTIISRTQIIKIEQQGDKDIKKEALSFIGLKTKERVDMVALIIKNNKDEENSGQLRYYATSFINEVESIFYQKWKIDRNNKETQFILEELKKCRGYLSTQGASVKMILEHLALVI
jgi:DNA polymerase III delta prime subunit